MNGEDEMSAATKQLLEDADAFKESLAGRVLLSDEDWRDAIDRALTTITATNPALMALLLTDSRATVDSLRAIAVSSAILGIVGVERVTS